MKDITLFASWIGFVYVFLIYKMTHLIFFRPLFFSFPPEFPSESIFLALISRIKSKKTLSTFSRVFAEVSESKKNKHLARI